MVGEPQTGPAADHRKGPRRRGEALHRAIFEATLAELEDVGYARLTMESVVRRAGTSKSSVHRRWNSVAELVMEALTHRYAGTHEPPPDTGDLREDLLAVLRRASVRLAGPLGEAARGLLGESLRDLAPTEFTLTRIIDVPSMDMVAVLHRAEERGQARPGASEPMMAKVGQIMLRHHFLVHGAPVPDDVIVWIVDEVVLPLVRS
ncbi:TetR/AcrR family transcriptional regulator [Spongiactinospora sp. 9N601]|uniref:TetR/AcrR family transcriptional regulator n=1 Tax=Spongiactinospora sp. 9N601 TaxID=3375149 RepID=UPI00378F6882